MSSGASEAVRRLLREPLVHFFVAGAILFAAFVLVGQAVDPPREEITVTSGQIESMAAEFERTWSRRPTEAELEALVDQYLREEVLYREGRAVGVDEGDPVIRLRVNQKMQLMTEDLVAALEPDEAELARYLAQHPEQFETPAETAFEQVFLDPHGLGSDPASVARLLADLNGPKSLEDQRDPGDRISLPRRMGPATPADITRTFGAGFAKSVAALPVGAWRGPIASGYGSHLVRVLSHKPAELPALDDIHDAVIKAWRESKREELDRRYIDELLSRYRTRVDWPASADD